MGDTTNDLKALSASDRAFITLTEGGWDSTSAYRVLFTTKAAPSSIPTIASRKKTSLQQFIRTAETVSEIASEVQQIEALSSFEGTLDKTEVLARMRKIAETSMDPKVQLMAYEKYATIEGLKREASATDTDQQVFFYLPLRCINACSLYADAVARGDIEPN